MTISTFWKSQTLRTTFMFALGGVSFSLGHLVLARTLPTAEYAWIALMMTFSQLSIGLAPLGAEILVNRFAVNPDMYLLRRAITSSLIAAALLTGIACRFYHFPPALALTLFVACAGVGPNVIAGALYQSRKMFRQSLLISQIHNCVFLVAAVAAVAFRQPTSVHICAILAAGFLVVPVIAWRVLLAESPRPEAVSSRSLPWREGYSLVARGGAIIILMQAERLSIPALLNPEALATFAVLAALVVSPFRMLQRGVNYTLLPRLRGAVSLSERRRLIAAEGAIVGSIVLSASVLILMFVPAVVGLFLGDKYSIGYPLILAAVIAGFGKLLSSFSVTSVIALGSSKDLLRINIVAWGALLIAACAAVIGSRYGLIGIVYGVGLGWYAQFIGSLVLALPHFRHRNGEGRDTPEMAGGAE